MFGFFFVVVWVAALVPWAFAVVHELEVVIGEEAQVLRFDSDCDVDRIAAQFVVDGKLSGGEGCRSSACVASMVASAMRQRLGESGEAVNRVSVSGVVYREQGRVAVERALRREEEEEETLALFRREALAPRRVAAPCVPPFCDIDCAISDANTEERIASDFLESNLELRTLMRSWPKPMVCEGGAIYPIFIGIPASEIVGCVPKKHRGFQGGVREKKSAAYAFKATEEKLYKQAYRDSYFGITKKKAGWDCMRHYEIIANGAVPFFTSNFDRCPSKTLSHWPKHLLKRIGTDLFKGIIDEGTLDAPTLDAQGLYPSVAAGLLKFARARLTTTALADYLLATTGHANARKVLFLSSHPDPDYQRDMLLHGLRQRLGVGLVDFIRPPHLYANNNNNPNSDEDEPPSADALYGYGFTYAQRLRDDTLFIDRSNIAQRIRDHEFDLVIFASVHRGMPFWPDVYDAYDAKDRVFVDGEDEHGWCPWSKALRSQGFFFMREIPEGCPPPGDHDNLNFSLPQYRDTFDGPFP